MKPLRGLGLLVLMILSGRGADAQAVTTGDGGKTVIETVTTPLYGTVTLTWPADANIAGSVRPGSPYWVPWINPDGSMALGTAVEFVDKLNENAYLGITTWSLPVTVYDDASCNLASVAGSFGYDCGQAIAGSPGYPYSELGNLFYNVMGGTAHNNIKQVHGPNYDLFHNVQPYLYWSQTAQSNALTFSNDLWFQNGFQGTESEYDSMFVIPVSVTATTLPTGLRGACADDPATCTGLLPGLGLTMTAHPAMPIIRTWG